LIEIVSRWSQSIASASDHRRLTMQPSPQLTPEEERSVRHWSFAVVIVYWLFLIAFLAAAILVDSMSPAGEQASDGSHPLKVLRASD
jgi:hypothetical protein